jgi:hypothetical protein
MQSSVYSSECCWKLPPLILHPFADSSGPGKLVDSSRASLMLQGLLPTEAFSHEQLDRTLLDGRFCELRMLYYVGKDLVRWVEQCVEMVQREEVLRRAGVDFQSFVELLIEDPPPTVKDKLVKWGVSDYKAIFSRAVGLNMVFAEAPEKDNLSQDFIRHYYRYADHMFECCRSMRSFAIIRSSNFDFELFASGEYSRMLEREWQEN